jgi:hypothetical protein
MDAIHPTVEVKLQIPQPLYQVLVETAEAEHQPLESIANQVLQAGLKTRHSWQQLCQALTLRHQERLQQEGKLNQSTAKVFQELQAVRDAIADELYPG